MATRGERFDDDDDDDDGGVAVEERPSPQQEQRRKQQMARSYANKKIESLEDLYALFPDLGDGSNRYYLKLTRLLPLKYMGHNISGYLSDLPNKVMPWDIKASFGGGKYIVQVMGPSDPDDEGDQTVRSLKSYEFIIPGHPVPHLVIGQDWQQARPVENAKPVLPIKPDVPDPPEQALAVQQHQTPQVAQQPVQPQPQQEIRPMMSTPHAIPMMPQAVFSPAPPPEPAQVQLKKLEIEAKRTDRDDERREQENRSQTAILQQSVANVKDAYERQIVDLQKRCEQLQQQLSEKDRAYYELQSKFDSEKNSSSYIQKQLDDVTRRFEALQNEERKLREERSKAVEESDRKWRERFDQEKQRYEDLRDRSQRELTQEKDRNNDLRAQQEKSLRDEMDRRLASQKENYDGRIQDLERNTKREIDTVREERDRRIDSMKDSTSTKLEAQRQSHETQLQSQKASFDIQFTTLGAELTRLRAENDRLLSKNDELQKKQNKDPIEYLNEVTHVATEVLGMSPAGSGGGGAEEGETDWKKMAVKTVFGIVEKAPEIMAQVQQTRAQNAQIQQRQRMNGHGQQQQMQRAPQPNGRQQMVHAPPPWEQNGIVAPLRPLNGQARSPQPPPENTPQPQQVPPPLPQQPMAPVQAVPQQQPQAQPQPPPTPEQQQQMQQQMLMLDEFIGRLDGAIREGVISPALFAKGIADQVGPQALAQLLQQFPTPDALFSAIEQTGHPSAIITRDGKKYTNELWRQAKQLVQS